MRNLALCAMMIACGPDPNGHPSEGDVVIGLLNAACERELQCTPQSYPSVSQCVSASEAFLFGDAGVPNGPQSTETNAQLESCEHAILAEDCAALDAGQFLPACQ